MKESVLELRHFSVSSAFAEASAVAAAMSDRSARRVRRRRGGFSRRQGYGRRDGGQGLLLQKQPVGVESKPATLRCFIHIGFCDASKRLVPCLNDATEFCMTAFLGWILSNLPSNQHKHAKCFQTWLAQSCWSQFPDQKLKCPPAS